MGTQIDLNRLEVAIGIAPEFVLMFVLTHPHLAGIVPTHGIANQAVCRKTLFLLIAVEGCAIETDEVVKAKPQMTFRDPGQCPDTGCAPKEKVDARSAANRAESNRGTQCRRNIPEYCAHHTIYAPHCLHR